MAKLNNRDWGLILLGAAFVGLGGYLAVSRTGQAGTNANGAAPRSEGLAGGSFSLSLASMSADVNLLGIDVKGGLTQESKLMHFFDPGHPMAVNPPNQQFTDTCHRYPTVTGTNISTLIHRGYSPLMVPSPRDYDWLVDPPGESYFGG